MDERPPRTEAERDAVRDAGDLPSAVARRRSGTPETIRGQLPPDQLAAWDRLWRRLLAPGEEQDDVDAPGHVRPV